ncbi:hypothetical protein DM02DRAFT_466219, partial [Periconia macrospinosa]
TESHWPCQSCSCKKGVFFNLDNECIYCSHSIMEHQDDLFAPWSPAIDYPCERQGLVNSVLKMVQDVGVVVIRATPQVGKTTLLNLLGRHIVHHEANLEPVYIEWKTREERKNVPYTEYMEREKQEYIKINAKQRAAHGTTKTRRNTRTIYLIDEAQFSYEEDKFWNLLAKNKPTRNSVLYVLVCVYGAQGISHARQAHIESQALQMHALHRIELRPTDHCPLSMLFSVQEASNVINKWAIDSRIPIKEVAYSRFFAGSETSDIRLKQLCINAIARFSPEALLNRSRRGGWNIPEAAFQNELYHCLNIERQHLPVLSEYSHRGNGRIDFFMSRQRWGIELLQSGTSSDIINHLTRFSTNGTYEQWRIMEDFMVINFCPRSALRKVAIEERFKPHFLNVVIEPQEFVAEIYSHDMQLIQSWFLGEGRERCNAISSSSVTPEL